MVADMLFVNGPVFQGLRLGISRALAIRDGLVLALGDDALAAAGPGTRRIDLAGRLVIPAFNEAHMHLLPYGLGLSQVNLRAEEVQTLDLLLTRIRAAAETAPKGSWILGRGYDHGALDIGRHPDMAELDAAAPNHPVFITRTCGHMGVANSAAMRLAGIGHNTPDPEGGVIERKGGRLTGLFQERAMRLVRDAMPVPNQSQMVDAIAAACSQLASLGFASATDMNVGMIAGMAEIAAYEAAKNAGRLPLRMWQVLAGNPEGIADKAWAAGLRPMAGDDHLRWGAVKVFADGSAGGLTAAFFEPYLPEAGGGTGVFTFSDQSIHALLKLYHEQGWQLDIHAIGDAAIEQVLCGMEAADTPKHPFPGRRHRIEHCGFVTRDQRRRMLARGILPVPQPVFMYEFGDLYVRNLGRERSALAYPMKTWLDEGHHPAASSDCPVSTVDPFVNLYTMLTRRTNKGSILGEDERLSVAEALHCYSWCGAYTQFAEERRGSLAPGMQADIAILSRDIFTLHPEEIRQAVVDATLREGQPIFDRFGEFS